MRNKYGSSASVAVFEKAARIRKFKYEKQMEASKGQSYAFLLFTACLIGAIVYNVIVGLLA